MQIREGAYYRTRRGDVVGPMRRRDDYLGDYCWESGTDCWTEKGEFEKGRQWEHDLISEVYVSDTRPTLITVKPGSSGGGGGTTPDTPRVEFAPPDQRQTAAAPTPEAKTLRDEFAMALMDADDFMVGFKEHAEQLYRAADAMMEARKK